MRVFPKGSRQLKKNLKGGLGVKPLSSSSISVTRDFFSSIDVLPLSEYNLSPEEQNSDYIQRSPLQKLPLLSR